MTHPYEALPDASFWRRVVAGVPGNAVDPVLAGKFRIGTGDRVATAGSCFTQHISRHLRDAGFTPFVTETAHPIAAQHAAEHGYGLFTARYGNLYTARQLLQLLQRAYGDFSPLDDIWPGTNGRFIDPFRPQVQPGGFASRSEFRVDRRQHFAAVRQAIETLDVLVFTLGLTETWTARADGAAYPICPGVAGGTFDAASHAFVNFGVTDVTADLSAAIEFIRGRNPRARVILTVSPVPLIATMEPRSVLASTTHSKARATRCRRGSGGAAWRRGLLPVLRDRHRPSYTGRLLRPGLAVRDRGRGGACHALVYAALHVRADCRGTAHDSLRKL